MVLTSPPLENQSLWTESDTAVTSSIAPLSVTRLSSPNCTPISVEAGAPANEKATR